MFRLRVAADPPSGKMIIMFTTLFLLDLFSSSIVKSESLYLVLYKCSNFSSIFYIIGYSKLWEQIESLFEIRERMLLGKKSERVF